MSNDATPRGYLSVLTLAFLAAVVVLLLVAAWDRPARANEPGVREVVVKLKPDASLSAVNSHYRTTTVEKLLGSAGIYRLRVPSTSNLGDVVSRMSNDGRLEYAEPNYTTDAPEGGARHRARTVGAPGTTASGQYAADAINLGCAQRINRGRGSVVAVLDTGAQLSHPSLAANFAGVARYDFVGDDADPSEVKAGLDADANGFKDELWGHGTHVAGIVDFVAPEAKIMPLRVLDSEGYGNVFTLVEAIRYAERGGADVINLSLSTSRKSVLLENAIKDAVNKDVIVVAAAGNANTYLEQYPAAIGGEVVSVSSVDRYNQKSDFANYGGWVDIVAPGNEIQSAYPTDTGAQWDGTSMATPFVAGQAALIRSVNPYLASDDAGSLISDTAKNLDSRLAPAYSGKLGKGLTNVGASLGRLSGNGACGG